MVNARRDLQANALRTALSLAVLAATVALLPVAEGAGKPVRPVAFDHAKETSKSVHRRLEVGDAIDINITNTATNCFAYNVERVVLDPPNIRAARPMGSATTTVTIVHEPQYGGYIVKISRSSFDGACGQGAVKDLPDGTVIIVADTQSIRLGVAGGFTFSDLTNPVYAAREENGGHVVFRNSSAEDDVDLSVGAFIHVFGDDWHPAVPALTFGLGVGEDSKTTYFLGPSWRLGDQLYVSVGLVASSIDTLPSGLAVGDPVAGPNDLANLGSKTDTGFFVGLSYTFLGKKDAFEKPFSTGQ